MGDSTASEKLVHFIRHGLAEHNYALEQRSLSGEEVLQLYATKYFDSRLTPEGEEDACALAHTLATLPEVERPQIVAVSPLSRAISTARAALPDGPFPFACVEELRERNGRWPCERRRTLTELKQDFPAALVDFAGLSEEDLTWTVARESRSEAAARAERCLRWIIARPEPVLAIVSHSGFMSMSLFDKANEALKVDPGSETALRAGWINCELRTVALSQVSMPDAEQSFRARARVVRVVKPKGKSPEVENKRRSFAAKNMGALYHITKELGASGVERRLRETGLPWYKGYSSAAKL
eukprot:gnl/TRDRNA2_/TRDRNA2_171690_c3_seq6.p1 gnl/TRDRNA2_/TRDRNA2_171690_c3~~gnl/TRDRNA2_/TRDRNA2_171690_c3_seq6.p1  ORF type:complete len:317 (-),score=52.11 gnl/TRDRNA2_/TRDRNA2_171690_c3_seq6:19-909(-)